jgi:hypothetical protein
MISLVQKVTFATNKTHHKVICQVNPDSKNGALNFYKKCWFRIHEEREKIIKDQLQLHKDLLSSTRVTQMIWVGSRCAIYLVYPFGLEDQTDTKLLSVIINTGNNTYLNWSKRHLKKVDYYCQQST